MTALHRVKAYFGMVPADELDSYDGYDSYADEDRYRGDRRDRYESDRYDVSRYESDRSERSERYDADRRPERLEGRYESDRRSSRFEEREAAELRSRASRSRDTDHADDTPDVAEAVPASRSSSRGRSWAQNTGPNHGSVRSVGSSGPSRSSLATAATSAGSSSSSSVAAPAAMASVGASSGGSGSGSGSSSVGSGASVPSTRGALAVDESRRRDLSSVAAPAETPAPAAAAPAEITTLQPTSYNEARVIGEKYRDGIPVIINLTELDDVAAKRLVDFAAGLAFALRGSIEKVTNRVFLLSPPNVEVSAAERKKFAEGAFTASS